MKITTLHVALPENWFEVPDARPRQFRSRDEDSGCLQISFNPPLEPDTEILAKLRDLMAAQPDLEEQAAASEELPVGPCVTILFKSRQVGLFQAWLIARPDVSLFATYTMGSVARAQYELNESAHIIRGLRFVSTLDSFEAYSPPPEPTRPWWKLW